ncbi:hypothetical protein M422DRAFT_66895 [Sphaerobolus stellatus SS14]|uniref:Uncharacterized protein n=1 Tax=Sphaerobolus stellatus (strain SS14) TaxID=990650 RepID=A0A0C9W2I2_SPHS4|nr:hypothetical protein M422DRAFT_66895 [Sphaerobolus stellatus SS14]
MFSISLSALVTGVIALNGLVSGRTIPNLNIRDEVVPAPVTFDDIVQAQTNIVQSATEAPYATDLQNMTNTFQNVIDDSNNLVGSLPFVSDGVNDPNGALWNTIQNVSLPASISERIFTKLFNQDLGTPMLAASSDANIISQLCSDFTMILDDIFHPLTSPTIDNVTQAIMDLQTAIQTTTLTAGASFQSFNTTVNQIVQTYDNKYTQLEFKDSSEVAEVKQQITTLQNNLKIENENEKLFIANIALDVFDSVASLVLFPDTTSDFMKAAATAVSGVEEVISTKDTIRDNITTLQGSLATLLEDETDLANAKAVLDTFPATVQQAAASSAALETIFNALASDWNATITWLRNTNADLNVAPVIARTYSQTGATIYSTLGPALGQWAADVFMFVGDNV